MLSKACCRFKSVFLPKSVFRLSLLLVSVAILSLTTTNLFDKTNPFGPLNALMQPSSSADKSQDAQSQACVIPKLTPGDAALRHLVWTSAKKTTPPKCLKTPVLFRVDVQSRLRRDESHPLSKSATDCYFKPVVRDYKKPEFQYLNTSKIYKVTRTPMKLPPSIQILFLWCVDPSGNITIYEDYLSAVQPKPELEAKLREREPRNKKDLWSVLMIGQDSCSHMNFQRYQPRVHDYLLKELDAIEFHGFNSLGAGTYQNVFPLFTGLPLPLYNKQCKPWRTHNESCPYIWKEFAARGYRTGFSGESIHYMGLFNYRYMRGFSKPTFGYDFREVVHILETTNLTGHEQGHYEKIGRFCHGSKMKVETLLEQALKMATTFKKKPFWFFAWTTSLSHFASPLAMYAEEPLLSTIRQMNENQLLNRTILVLLSDHGFPWGPFRRSSRQGFLEDRLPMLYIALPKAFRQKYPLALENMKGNVNRLTTMYDFHATLQHLVHPETLEDAAVESKSRDSTLEESKSVSLFLPISRNRTCENVPFQDMYCICLDRQVLSPEESSAETAAAAAIAEINKRLSNYTQCHQLSVANVTQAFKLRPKQVSHHTEHERFHTDKDRANQLGTMIEVEIETQPGNGAFSCSVSQSYDNGKHKYVTRIEIVRVNYYGHAGDCVADQQLRPLCYCR